MRKMFFNWVFTMLTLSCLLVLPAPLLAEPPVWEIYNSLYGDSYVGSDQELWDNYGVEYDEIWLTANGYVMAIARFAGYNQRFGYYADGCVGNERVELFDVKESGYLNPDDYGTFFIDGDADTVGFYVEP